MGEFVNNELGLEDQLGRASLAGPAKPSRRDDGIRLDGITIITPVTGDCHRALDRKDAKSNRAPRYDLNMARLRYDSAYSISAHYAKSELDSVVDFFRRESLPSRIGSLS